jgi:Rrf2 family nitric oxide-sensitive transcriptional repressor
MVNESSGQHRGQHLTVDPAAAHGIWTHQGGAGGDIARVGRPKTIIVGAVLRRTEPDLAVVSWFCAEGACAVQPACVLQGALRGALEAFLAVLDRVTLADLVRPKQRLVDLLKIEPAA